MVGEWPHIATLSFPKSFVVFHSPATVPASAASLLAHVDLLFRHGHVDLVRDPQVKNGEERLTTAVGDG